MLSNLLGNAIKFTADSGIVTMGVREEGVEILFWVSDSGPEIDEVLRSQVFDRYWRLNATRRNGPGLGLFICKGIVEAHRGQI